MRYSPLASSRHRASINGGRIVGRALRFGLRCMPTTSSAIGVRPIVKWLSPLRNPVATSPAERREQKGWPCEVKWDTAVRVGKWASHPFYEKERRFDVRRE